MRTKVALFDSHTTRCLYSLWHVSGEIECLAASIGVAYIGVLYDEARFQLSGGTKCLAGAARHAGVCHNVEFHQHDAVRQHVVVCGKPGLPRDGAEC